MVFIIYKPLQDIIPERGRLKMINAKSHRKKGTAIIMEFIPKSRHEMMELWCVKNIEYKCKVQ